MSEELEWIGRSPSPLVEPTAMDGWTAVEMPEAHALIVGPDEILVVVLPQMVNRQALDEHRARVREVLGNRFIMVVGSDVQLAKVKPEDWARNAIDRGK